MSRQFFVFLFALFLNTWAGDEHFSQRGDSPEARGAWVARQADERDTGRDARIAMRMKLFDRQGRVRERALTVTSMRGGPGRPVPGDRSLVRFTYPNDIKGTAFLVWEQPASDDERFLYLPSLGRVRRIAGSEAQESFVGSDLTYEDIGGREFENYSYRLIEKAGPTSVWTAIDGSKHDVFTLESRARDANARFPRVVSTVRQDNFVIVRAEIYNKRNELQKLYEAIRVDRVSGYWTVMELRMSDNLQRTRTELSLDKVEYNVGLTADDFSRRTLERGGTVVR
jgi:Outer membrane lipoprotein-sorting protein